MVDEHVYEPAEDSELLVECALDEVKDKKTICEVGVGSGFVLSSIQKIFPDLNYSGTDINPFAIKEAKNYVTNTTKINQTNLLEGMDQYDLILFNAPYLPLDDEIKEIQEKDKALYGGKKGYEIVLEWIDQLGDHLEKEGSALLIISSLTQPQVVEEYLTTQLFTFEVLKEQKHFFEKLFCYKIQKSELLKKLSRKRISNISYLAKGKHSKVFSCSYKKQKSIIKIAKEQHLEKEIYFLKRLKKEPFIPQLLLDEKEFVVMEKIEGRLIFDFFDEGEKEEVFKSIDSILEVCYRLDELSMNKFEMINPYKHVFVQDDLSIKMIDYERMIFTEKPKNTTQFLQCLKRSQERLEKRGIKLDSEKIERLARSYKKKSQKIKVQDLI